MTNSRELVVALGGPANITELSSCAVRIRATVVDPSAVDEPSIRATDALGVVRSGNYVQIIFRYGADELAEQMSNQISLASADH